MASSSSDKKMKIIINSPVILGFALICTVVLFLDSITSGKTTTTLFSVYRSSLTSPLTYVRFIGHVFGHASLSHLVGNMMMILLIGPILEEKYGSKLVIYTITVTAVFTGLIDFIFFPDIRFLGASGVVFAFIILASISGIREKEIPLTFILVAVLYIGQQIIDGVFVKDNVSQFTHIVGGVIGALIGYRLNVGRRK